MRNRPSTTSTELITAVAPPRRQVEPGEPAWLRQAGVSPGRASGASARPSTSEEIVNAATHAVGVALSAAALALLVERAAARGGLALAGAIVFGVTLILLYTASTLYHLVSASRASRALRLLDHAGIYLLIAGTYTPFSLVTLRGRGGAAILAAVWALAIAGIVIESAWLERPRWLSVLVYLGMGWLVLLRLSPLREGLERGGLALLIAGGLVYSGGTIFYLLGRVRYMHAVWHLFVLGGSVCHVLAVGLYVI